MPGTQISSDADSADSSSEIIDDYPADEDETLVEDESSPPDSKVPDGARPPVDPNPETPMEELVVANGRYLIRSVHSQRCLDIPNAEKTNGIGLEIYDCASSPSAPQVFELLHMGDKFYQIRNVATGKSLEVRGQVLAQEKRIQQGDYVGAQYQQFEFQPQSDGTYVIKCRGANLVFDVAGARVDNKTPVQIWPPNNFVNERWTLTLL